MMRFCYETLVVVVGLVTWTAYRLFGDRQTADEIWADVGDELCQP